MTDLTASQPPLTTAYPRVMVSSTEPGTSQNKFDTKETTTATMNSAHSIETSTAATTPGSEGIPSTISIVLVAIISVLILIVVIVYLLRKSRPLSCNTCLNITTRKRRSSTSSQGPLTQDDATFVTLSVPRTEQELFSIADQDGGQDGHRESRGRRNTEDDYFYDEIFERSAFVDESTYRANKQLTVEHEEDDEILGDTHVPDLIFKKSNKQL